MTPEKQAEMLQEVQQMIDNPALAAFVQELPDGRRMMQVECVAGLLFETLRQCEEAVEEIVKMVNSA